MSKEPHVSFSHVDKVYFPNQHALRDVDFRIAQGEFVFLTGASGAGKSTLMKLIFAEERCNRGTVVIGSNDVGLLGPEQVANHRRNIGVIFQDYKLLPNRSILENVAFVLEVVGVRKEQRLELSYKMLVALGLEERISALPRMLSGGEQQRVAIARALITRPKLILADEPTGNLDPDMTVTVFNLLLQANACGATVLVASHNLALIEELNKRTIVLDKGTLIGDFLRPKG
ncbi:MAG: ATP-binding cassette domain-containing protein [Proteobacteria bacterium]|nr:ATP-binding cassette domain-containing protein [Pseudomonadota bacterium]